MPTVLNIYGFRFFFFSNEKNEPKHIHVEKNDCYAKFWITPIGLAYNYGFTSKELKQIGNIIEEKIEFLIEKWNEHFSQ